MAEMLPLQVICLNVPPIPDGTEFGLQDRDRVLHSGEMQSDGSMLFRCEVKAVEKDGALRLTGDFVHGSSADRILYLGLRPLGGADDAWIRRWKIPLAGIDAAMVRQALDAGGSVACTIDATKAARVRLVGEWVASV